MSVISRYIHRCIVEEGPAEGNKYIHSVSGIDLEMDNHCENCNKPFRQEIWEIAAYVYEELTSPQLPD